MAAVALASLVGGATGGARRVNWFVPTGGVGHSLDGLNNTAWARAHKDALTGYYYCCACWAICPHASDPLDKAMCRGKKNGTFINTGRCPGLSGIDAGGPPFGPVRP